MTADVLRANQPLALSGRPETITRQLRDALSLRARKSALSIETHAKKILHIQTCSFLAVQPEFPEKHNYVFHKILLRKALQHFSH
jgi:hypothetical protein